MAANSLYPSFVRIFYHSQFGSHVMTLPTLQYSSAAIGTLGEFATWDAGSTDADEMINALVDDIAGLYVEDETTFDNYEIFNMATPTSDPTWQYGGTLGVTGTLASAVGWREAVQCTYTFRTSLGGIARLVLLDRPTENVFARLTTLSAPEALIATELGSTARGWAGRDGGQFAVFKNQTITLNERLRREYGLG